MFIIGKFRLPKRKNAKHISERERKVLLEIFIENLDNDDNDNIFENSDSESDDNVNTDMNVTNPNNNTTNVNTDSNENENESMHFSDDEEDNELPNKIKFKFLDEIKTEENSDPVNQVHDEEYSYSSANRQFEMKWFSKSNNARNAVRQPACNIIHE